MRLYHLPAVFRFLYHKNAIWNIPGRDKKIYLTFDDGPTPEITEWVLDILDEYKAKATFFCIGANVEKYPALYQEMLKRGHKAGNHTFHHLNGWKTETSVYGQDVVEAGELIDSNLFRPPYGRMKRSQQKLIADLGYKTVLWTVLTYDFDKTLNQDEAWNNIKKLTGPGAILVFHDSIKAFENVKTLLPKTLDHFSRSGYTFEAINLNS